MARLTPTLIAIAALAIGIEAQAYAKPTASSSALSPKEQATLENGGLVVREKQQRRGELSLFGGHSWQLLSTPLDAVWAAMQNPNYFRFMLPQVRKSTQISHSGNARKVRIAHGLGPIEIAYTVSMKYKADDHLILFDLGDASTIRAGWGFVRAKKWSERQTLVSFGAMVDVGEGVLAHVLRSRIQEWLLKIPLTMKWYLEGDGRKRYIGKTGSGNKSF